MRGEHGDHGRIGWREGLSDAWQTRRVDPDRGVRIEGVCAQSSLDREAHLLLRVGGGVVGRGGGGAAWRRRLGRRLVDRRVQVEALLSGLFGAPRRYPSDGLQVYTL